MSVQRTVKVRLVPAPEQTDALLETLRQHTECFNAVGAFGWEHREKNGVRLHHATYRALRRRFPAQLVVTARERARALARARRAKKASRPKSRLGPIRYDARTYALRTAKGNVSLESVAGRLKMSFAADLICRKGRFWLHVVVTLPDVEFRPSGSVVGVDMGRLLP